MSGIANDVAEAIAVMADPFLIVDPTNIELDGWMALGGEGGGDQVARTTDDPARLQWYQVS